MVGSHQKPSWSTIYHWAQSCCSGGITISWDRCTQWGDIGLTAAPVGRALTIWGGLCSEKKKEIGLERLLVVTCEEAGLCVGGALKSRALSSVQVN